MKPFIPISLFLPLYCSNQAFALKIPDPAQVAVLQAEIDQIHKIQGVSTDTEQTGIAGDEALWAKEASRIDPNTKMMASFRKEIDQMRSEQASLCQKIINDTRDVYGIKPQEWSGTIVAGRFADNHASWYPRFGKMNLERTATDAAGHSITMNAMPYVAVVWDNGDMTVTLPAFSYSPGYLAALLYHETIHFEQITTKGRGDRITPFEREQQAFDAMQSFRNQQYFGLTEIEKNVIEETRRKELRRLESSAVGYMVGAIGLDPNEPVPNLKPEPARDAGDASFLQGLGQLPAVSQEARNGFAAQEAADQQKWKNDPEYVAYQARFNQYAGGDPGYIAEANRIQEHFVDMAKHWEYLRIMTGLACSDPDALDQLGRDGKVPGVGISDLDLDWEMSRTEGSGNKERLVVNACQKYILTAIRNATGLVPGHHLATWARRYREEHPSLLSRFATSIGDFFSSMGSAYGGGGSSDSFIGSRQGGGMTDAQREQWRASLAAQDRDAQEIANVVHGVFSGTGNKSWDGNSSSRVTQ